MLSRITKSCFVVLVLFVCCCLSINTFHLKAQDATPTDACSLKIRGDANCDSTIDLLDFEEFRQEFLQFRKNTLDITNAKADFNNDKTVDLLDFEIFRTGYTSPSITPTQTAIPTIIGTITPTVPPTSDCTKIIAATVTTISNANPGDVLCLAPGSRKDLTVDGVKGTASNPITIRNDGGKTVISGGATQAGIQVLRSSFIRITGGNSNCGSEFSSNKQECGIQITASRKGVDIEGDNGAITHDIEVDHIQMDNALTSGWGTGVSIKPRYNATLSGFKIHHNYIYKAEMEGMYIGSDPGKPLEDNGFLKDVEIAYNLVENTGFDGINVKQATGIVKVHHNIVKDTGGLNGQIDHVPEGGIKLAASNGEVFNNLVLNSNNSGIGHGRPLNNPNTRYYNNIIVNSKTIGIEAKESGALIFNNTVINSGTAGIDTGTASKVYDNIVTGTGNTIIGGQKENNFIGTTQEAGFNNAAAGDYSLKDTSLLIDAGRNKGIFPAIDYIGTTRPQGSKTDIGAYEAKK